MKEYKTEAELCTAFIEWVRAESGQYRNGSKTPIWTPYAETAGWDILLVSDTGVQIGIEAKLKFNMKVLSQCLPDYWDSYGSRPGPDYRAVLVPKFDSDHWRICAALGLVMIATQGHGTQFRPDMRPESGEYGGPMWHSWNPAERCKLPEYLPDVEAGRPAPLRLTEWKVKALRILATIDVRGYVTKQDFKTQRIDPRAWVGPNGYLVTGAAPGQWVRGKAEFDKHHPIVYAQVLAEVRAEVAKEAPAPLPPQESMFSEVA